MNKVMTKKIWTPDTNDPELLAMYVKFEELYAKFNSIKIRITRFKIETQNAEAELIKINNNINNLKSKNSKIVSIKEYNLIKREKNFIKTFIKNKKECIVYDTRLLKDVQKNIKIIQKQIDARQNITNVIPFRKR
ncbi:hypothetical protein EBU95_03805 [bacterium]|nr:hypothetical protein [bacterium]